MRARGIQLSIRQIAFLYNLRTGERLNRGDVQRILARAEEKLRRRLRSEL